jgi:hypothetical protein
MEIINFKIENEMDGYFSISHEMHPPHRSLLLLFLYLEHLLYQLIAFCRFYISINRHS